MDRTRILGLLLATVLASACGSATVPADTAAAADHVSPTDPCAESRDRADTICPTAIALANARLGWLHWPVTSTTFRVSLCPRNARCAWVPGGQGWVVFTFWIGDPVMIHVGPPEAGSGVMAELTAGEPEPLPDWLLGEMAKAR